MNLQERIEALETEFAEKVKALKAEAQREDNFPQDGDRYWYMTTTGKIFTSNWDGFDFDFDEAVLEIGNIFQTKEQAEFAVEKLKVEAELRKFGRPFKNGEDNYHIVLIDGEAVKPDRWTIVQNQGTIYFESEEKVRQAIKSVGEDRIKKYIFGVEE